MSCKDCDKKKRSGKSKSMFFPNGQRRKFKGREMAPKSLRKKGKTFLDDCSDSEKEKAGV